MAWQGVARFRPGNAAAVEDVKARPNLLGLIQRGYREVDLVRLKIYLDGQQRPAFTAEHPPAEAGRGKPFGRLRSLFDAEIVRGHGREDDSGSTGACLADPAMAPACIVRRACEPIADCTTAAATGEIC